MARTQYGAAYVLALTTLMVGMILGLATLRFASSRFFQEDSLRRFQSAYNMAEAGVDYVFWRLHYDGAHLPLSETVTLGTGSFQVTAVDDGSRDRSTVLVTSTGTVGRDKYTIRRVILGLLPYEYARCENSSVIDGEANISTGTGRGIRANGEVRLNSPSNNVTTGAWATTTITCSGTVLPRYPSSPPIRFPDIDLNYYFYTAADYVYWFDVTFNPIWYPGGKGIALVYGKVWIKGVYNGVYTIVATDDVSINGNLTAANSGSRLAIISTKKITIEATATNVEAVLYCHNTAGTGVINVKGVTSIKGSVSADTISTDKSTTFNPDPSVDITWLRKLKMPGLQ
ncbi:MAG: hypothetical protein QHI38_02565 [Armatimonadota bacterium]|nr:hypothetical protein [Armatimonadota bacterium]